MIKRIEARGLRQPFASSLSKGDVTMPWGAGGYPTNRCARNSFRVCLFVCACVVYVLVMVVYEPVGVQVRVYPYVSLCLCVALSVSVGVGAFVYVCDCVCVPLGKCLNKYVSRLC